MDGFIHANLTEVLLAVWAQPIVKACLIGLLCLWLSGMAVALKLGTFTLAGVWDIIRPTLYALFGGAILQLAVVGQGVEPEKAAATWSLVLVGVWAKVAGNAAQLLREDSTPPTVLRSREL